MCVSSHTGDMQRRRQVRVYILGLLLSFSGNVFSQDLTPQSPEAWNALAAAGKKYISSVYDVTGDGLVCHETREKDVRTRVEALAALEHVHPARVAEAATAYLWGDWTLLHVPGPPLRAAVDGGKETLEPYLESAYQAHHVCLLGILKVLVDGYEGDYVQTDKGYSYAKKGGGERYKLLAFEPKYFPGSGFLEPLGVVQAVRNADLLRVDWVRAKVLNAVVASTERRKAEGGDPLKIKR